MTPYEQAISIVEQSRGVYENCTGDDAWFDMERCYVDLIAEAIVDAQRSFDKSAYAHLLTVLDIMKSALKKGENMRIWERDIYAIEAVVSALSRPHRRGLLGCRRCGGRGTILLGNQDRETCELCHGTGADPDQSEVSSHTQAPGDDPEPRPDGAGK